MLDRINTSTDAFLVAKKFLENLDPQSTSFTFQTFDDTPAKRPHLTRVFSGTLEAHFRALLNLNRQGASVNVTVQQTDGNGRKLENIKAVRTLFFEHDGKTKFQPSDIPLRPSMVVNSSPGRYHLYYLLDEHQAVTNETAEQFKTCMAYMISKGSDPSAKDLSRCLRIPGFHNNKYPSKPLVTLSPGRCLAHSWQTMVNTFQPPILELSFDDIDFFTSENAPSCDEPFESARVASALAAIDPSCDHGDWLRIGMALHHATNGSEEGYEMFKRWSEGGSNFNETDWPAQWNYFRQDKPKPITIASLFHIAMDAGWDGHFNLELEGFHKLIQRQRNNYFRHVNKRFALLKSSHGVAIVSKSTTDLGHWSYELMTPAQAKVFFANQKIPTWGTPRSDGSQSLLMKNAYEQWIESPLRKDFKGLEFVPHKNIVLGPTPDILPETIKLNTYFGLHNPGRKGEFPNIQRHIMEVWCKYNKQFYEYVMNWFAQMFQKPGEPAGTCLTIRSDRQGAGKNVIVDPLIRAFGTHGNKFSTQNEITGTFNSLMAESIFVVLEEAVFSNSNQAKSLLKSLTTSDTSNCEKKFYDKRQIKNCVHLLCLSNSDYVVPIQPGDRRYPILDCDNKYAGNWDYFDVFRAQIANGESDALIWYLRHRDISNFNPFDFPKTGSTRAKAMEIQLDSVEMFVQEALEEGTFTFSMQHLEDEGELSVIEKRNIPRSVILEAYQRHYDSYRANNYNWKFATPTQFGIKMKKIFPDQNIWKVSSARVDGKPLSSYMCGDLYSMRRAFDKYLGAERDWDTGDELYNEIFDI